MTSKTLALFCSILAVSFLSSCGLIGKFNQIEQAIADVAEANQDFLDAYNALDQIRNDPVAQQAKQDLADGVIKVREAIDELKGGNLDESCASRCSHECSGLQVASCVLNCSTSNCHPSCCGCKDGSAGCNGCGASCGHDVDGEPIECKRE